MRLRPFLAALFGLLVASGAWAQSNIESFPSIGTAGSVYPLPDPAFTVSDLWITQAINGTPTDFKIDPLRLGYIFPGGQPPAIPYLYQLWWDNASSIPNPILKYYNGTQWIPLFSGGTPGTVVQINQGDGITLSPNPIVTIGSVACTQFTTQLNGCVVKSGSIVGNVLHDNNTWGPVGDVTVVTPSTADITVSQSPTFTFNVGTTVPLNVQSGASYTILTTDNTKAVQRTHGSAQTDTVPQAVSPFNSGISFYLQTGAAGDTVTPTTSTINGAGGVKLGAYQDTFWYSDGANWWALLGVPQPPAQAGSTFLADDMTWKTALTSINLTAVTPIIATPGTITGTGSLSFATCGSTNVAFVDCVQTFTAAQTFNETLGAMRRWANLTDTLSAADCGKSIEYTGGAATVTVPASMAPVTPYICYINIITTTANKVSVNGSAVTPVVTLISAETFTGTNNIAGSVIGLSIDSTATAYLTGDGS